jgi:hypothetical protein
MDRWPQNMPQKRKKEHKIFQPSQGRRALLIHTSTIAQFNTAVAIYSSIGSCMYWQLNWQQLQLANTQGSQPVKSVASETAVRRQQSAVRQCV